MSPLLGLVVGAVLRMGHLGSSARRTMANVAKIVLKEAESRSFHGRKTTWTVVMLALSMVMILVLLASSMVMILVLLASSMVMKIVLLVRSILILIEKCHCCRHHGCGTVLLRGSGRLKPPKPPKPSRRLRRRRPIQAKPPKPPPRIGAR